MIAAGLATGATSVASAGLSTLVSAGIQSFIFGNYNPKYNKKNRKRMRHIQRKYLLAYKSNSFEDIDPCSRLILTQDGTKPANPFQDETQYEESLLMNFYPVSGHQGRFAASHAMQSIGMINDYQNIRKLRPWIPGVSSPGQPNDYINMFLEESKQWIRSQLTLDILQADELIRRDSFYTKLKNDNYFWCFPPETESRSIHRVIDFLHDKIKNALGKYLISYPYIVINII